MVFGYVTALNLISFHYYADRKLDLSLSGATTPDLVQVLDVSDSLAELLSKLWANLQLLTGGGYCSLTLHN